MKKLFVCMILAAAVFKLHATLDFYDSFNYSPTDVQLANVTSPAWVAYPVPAGGVHPTNTAGSLSYPGLQTASGDNSVLFSGIAPAAGVAARNLSHLYNIGNAPTLYYSLTFKVTSIVTADWGGSGNWVSGSFMLGFNQRLQDGTALAQADAAAPLLIRTGDPLNASGTANDFQSYQLGVGVTATTATRTFDATHNYNPGDTLFLVVSYTFNGGASDDVAKLYVNPIPGSLESANTPVVTTAAGALDVTGNQIQSFFLRNNSVEPSGTQVDDLRVGTNWADVTPVAPLEPPIIVSLNTIINNGAANNPIGVRFDQEVTLPSATNPVNYVVNAGTVSVADVHLRPDGRSVEVVTTAPVGEFFSVCATNVQGAASNSAPTIATGYTSEYSGITIGTPGDPVENGQVYTSFWDTFDVTVGGSGFGVGLDDHFHFIQQGMTGDFDVRVRVTALDMADFASQAGLMARESLAANSASIQTFFTPTGGLNQIRATVRPVAGTDSLDFLTSPPVPAAQNNWLRLSRSNDVFTAYYATNDIDWIISGVTTQGFATNLFVGMAVSAHSFVSNTTAGFTDFYAQGAQVGDEIHPTLAASLNGTNIEFTWPQTPRSYALEISPSLVGSNQWGLLVIPTFFNVSNRVFKTGFPASLLGSQLFARNVRVHKLIPDIPVIMVNGGITLSPGKGLKPATAGTLCTSPTYQVTNAYTYTNSYIYMTNPTSLSWIDTLQSSSGMDTVLSVANSANPFATFCNDNSVSPADVRSKYVSLPTPYVTLTRFGIVAAAKKTSIPSTGITINLQAIPP